MTEWLIFVTTNNEHSLIILTIIYIYYYATVLATILPTVARDIIAFFQHETIFLVKYMRLYVV